LEIAQGDVDSAFNRLLRCIRTFEGPEQAKAKSQLLELFALVDPADPRLVKARSALASALF
jgi:putative thioredoxin